MPAPVTRRQALLLLGVGAGAGLAACTGAGEPPTPARTAGPTADPVPARPVPRPTPTVPDLPELERALGRAREVLRRTLAVRGARGEVARLLEEGVAAHRTQVEVLERMLTAGGAPPEPDDAATTSSREVTQAPDDVTATTSAARQEQLDARVAAEVEELAQLLRQDGSADALAALTRVSRLNLPVLLSITGERTALAGLLGAAVRFPAPEGPAGSLAADLVHAYRPAVYGFEVLAARAEGDERRRFVDALGWLRRAEQRLTTLAGDAAPPPRLGYGLPGPLRGEEDRAALARRLLAVLSPALLSAAGDAAGDAAGISGCAAMLDAVLRHGRRWSGPLQAFPGMRAP